MTISQIRIARDDYAFSVTDCADEFLIGFFEDFVVRGSRLRITFPILARLQPSMSAAPSGLDLVSLLTQHLRAGLSICRAYGALGFASLALLTFLLVGSQVP